MNLQETVNTIGLAYDTLHREIKELADIAEKTPSPPSITESLITELDKQTQSKDKPVLYPQDFQVQTVTIQKMPKKIGSVLFKTNKSTEYTPNIVKKDPIAILDRLDKGTDVKNFDNVQESHEKSTKVLVKNPLLKNASMITRYPIKSTGVAVGNDKSSKHSAVKQHKEKHHTDKDRQNKNFIYKKNKASSAHMCYKDYNIRNIDDASDTECNWKF